MANKTQENPTYEIGFGEKGNGTTVWNRNQIENNDYKTIAHISTSGQVNFYDKNLPEEIKKQINVMANIKEAKFDQDQYNGMRKEEKHSVPYDEQAGYKEMSEYFSKAQRKSAHQMHYGENSHELNHVFDNPIEQTNKHDIEIERKNGGIIFFDKNRPNKNEKNGYTTIADFKNNGRLTYYDLNLSKEIKDQIIDTINKQPLIIIPLNQEQKNDLIQNPFYQLSNYGLPKLTTEQLNSIPDVIENHKLSKQDKLVLMESKLDFKDDNATYIVNDNNIIKEQSEASQAKVLTNADVVFSRYIAADANINDREIKATDLKADPDRNGLYNPDGNDFTDTYIDHIEQQKLDSWNENYQPKDQRKSAHQMDYNENRHDIQDALYEPHNYQNKNLQYLNDQLKFFGFGTNHETNLSKSVNNQEHQFQLPVTKSFFIPWEKEKQSVNFSLHFNKAKDGDMYFLNSYTARKSGQPEEAKQEFFINKGKGFTAKEAFNLLSDRFVNKDLTNKNGERYNAWIGLKSNEGTEIKNKDFKIFTENYGFNLIATLAKFEIKEMKNPETAERLINSLKRGNAQAATFIGNNGEEIPKFISANPQFKNVNILNENGKQMYIEPKTNPFPAIEENSSKQGITKPAGIKR